MVAKMKFRIFVVTSLMATPALASTPNAWAKLDKASEAACLAAAKLTGGKVEAPIRYSDKTAIDARIVEGSRPQPHMKGAKARMLCLYNRKTKRVEVQELADAKPAVVVAVKDVWWRATEIGGAGLVSGSEVTMMLGSDGKVGGRSGCNGYSAGYRLEGEAMKLLSPVIGTRMACAPALMTQEARASHPTVRWSCAQAAGRLAASCANSATPRLKGRDGWCKALADTKLERSCRAN
jgi:hypothetical protein